MALAGARNSSGKRTQAAVAPLMGGVHTTGVGVGATGVGVGATGVGVGARGVGVGATGVGVGTTGVGVGAYTRVRCNENRAVSNRLRKVLQAGICARSSTCGVAVILSYVTYPTLIIRRSDHLIDVIMKFTTTHSTHVNVLWVICVVVAGVP